MGLFSNFFNFSGEPAEEKKDFAPQFLLVMGDMNFRVNMSYTDSMRVINAIKHQNLRGHDLQKQINTLLAQEQLTNAMKGNRSLRNIKEKLITFLPTFKLEEKSDLYAHEKQRTPSW